MCTTKRQRSDFFCAMTFWFIIFFSPILVNARVIPPTFHPFPFANATSGHSFAYNFCTKNGVVDFADVYPTLELESQVLLAILQDAGGVEQLYKTFLQSSDHLVNGLAFPPVIQALLDTSAAWGAIECCVHPTAFIEPTYAFGCPRNVSVCVFDTRMDKTPNQIALTPPGGCCPVESPNACFARKAGGGVKGCCPDAKSSCCYAEADGAWLGCAASQDECCGDKICPAGYTCCRGKHLLGSVCCPKYGGACFDDDYFAYGLNRTVQSTTREYYDDTDPAEQPMLLGEFFGLSSGYHGCLPVPGGQSGPVINSIYITNETERYADGYCEDHSERTTHRLRPHLRRMAFAPEDLDADLNPFYSFDAEDLDLDALGLNIDAEAQQFGGIGDLNFTECGRHLCYGERDYCVKRYRKERRSINHRVINVTETIDNYNFLYDEAILNGTDLPEPINLEDLTRRETLCAEYNNTYLQQLISDGIYGGLLSGEPILPQYEYLLPTDCIVYDTIPDPKEHALGCCPLNTTACAAFPHSLSPDVPDEYPVHYSLYDKLHGCASYGETCCGQSICSVGMKCCSIRFTVDGGFDALLPDGSTNETISVTDLYLRPALMYDILLDLPPNKRNYMTGIFDITEHCCPEYSFCCQVDVPFRDIERFGRRFFFYCSIDPLCKRPIWPNGMEGVASQNNIIDRGYPSQFVEDDLSIDLNSDGRFEYETDILPTFKKEYPVLYESDPETGVIFESTAPRGNIDTKCNIGIDGLGKTLSCGQLSGTFKPDTDSEDMEDGNRRRSVEGIPNGLPPTAIVNPKKRDKIKPSWKGVRKIGSRTKARRAKQKREKRHTTPNLDNYPPPPPSYTSEFVKFDLISQVFEVDTSSIFTIKAPISDYLRPFADFTEQLFVEGFFGQTFIGFPMPSEE